MPTETLDESSTETTSTTVNDPADSTPKKESGSAKTQFKKKSDYQNKKSTPVQSENKTKRGRPPGSKTGSGNSAQRRKKKLNYSVSDVFSLLGRPTVQSPETEDSIALEFMSNVLLVSELLVKDNGLFYPRQSKESARITAVKIRLHIQTARKALGVV